MMTGASAPVALAMNARRDSLLSSSVKAAPREVRPLAITSFHTKSYTQAGPGLPFSSLVTQRTSESKVMTASFISACSFSSEMSLSRGIISSMARLTFAMLPLADILPEESTSRKRVITLLGRALVNSSMMLYFLSVYIHY